MLRPTIQTYMNQHNNTKAVEQYKNQNSKETKDKEKTPEIPKDKSKIAGVIEINSVNIKAPIYPGKATPKQLDRGISFVEDDESLDNQNISIAGHTSNINSKYQFTPLQKVSTGDEVKFKVGNETRVYKMTDIKNVPPDKVEILDEQKGKKDQLTLITCDHYNEMTDEWEDRKIYIAEYIKTE